MPPVGDELDRSSCPVTVTFVFTTKMFVAVHSVGREGKSVVASQKPPEIEY